MERRRLERELRKAASTAAAAHKRRDELIVEASRSGMSYAEIAAIVSLTFGRVGQIVRRDTRGAGSAAQPGP
jgi:DNA-directed RNA polymerase specialized sigma24 family protein